MVSAKKCLMDLLDVGESYSDYNKITRQVNELKSGTKRKIRAPYSQVRKEKVAAGLAPEDIWVTDSDVGTTMQKILNKTVDRILIDENIVDRIEDLKHQNGQIRVELIHKFG